MYASSASGEGRRGYPLWSKALRMAIAIALIWPLGVVRPQAASAVAVIERASLAWDGAQSDMACDAPAVSADGRYVAFVSKSDYLGKLLDDNSALDVFVRDMVDDTVRCVSVNDAGVIGDGPSSAPSISGDGRYVAFVSGATNLVADDTNGVDDVFVYDTVELTITRVSRAYTDPEPNGSSAEPDISADGNWVAFESRADNLVEADGNFASDVFITEIASGKTRLVSADSSGVQGNADSAAPAVAADGSFVAFHSFADNLVEGDKNLVSDVFVWEYGGDSTTRVSVDSVGTEGDGASSDPAISADGAVVAFQSVATNLMAGDTNGVQDIFAHQRSTGQTRRVSVTSVGDQATGPSEHAGITGNGRYVTFGSRAADLVAGDLNSASDVFVYDRITRTQTLVSVNPSAEPAAGDSTGPAIGDLGYAIVFESLAADIVGDDTNLVMDVFSAPFPANSTPVAVDDYYATNEDQALSVSAASGVLDNDTDADGDPLIAVNASDPPHGTVVLSTNGSFLYTPDADFSGTDTFSYQADDGGGPSPAATVRVRVDPVNDPPVGVTDNYTTSEDTLVTISAPGVLVNDSDPEGNPLTAVSASDPPHGAVSLNTDGGFTYTPDGDYYGADSFTYQASDGATQSAPVTVNITVTGSNDAPMALDDTVFQMIEKAENGGTPAAGADAGYSVAVSGNVAVVGVPEGGLLGRGEVLVYERDATGWSFSNTLVAYDGQMGDLFGHAVAIDGDLVAVGAYADDDNGGESGAVYTFVRDPGSGAWLDLGKLVPADGQAGARFGFSVGISEGSIIVGAPLHDEGGANTGSVYFFHYDHGVWVEQKPPVPYAFANQQLGTSVAIDGSRAVVGMPGWDFLETDCGSAVVYTRTDVTWSFGALLEPPYRLAGDRFGDSVAISGDRVLVGAPAGDMIVADAGVVQVFEYSGDTWWAGHALYAYDSVGGERLGTSLALEGNTAWLGAPGYASSRGAVYRFVYEGGETGWRLNEPVLAPDGVAGDRAGCSVGFDKNAFVFGANMGQGWMTDSGTAYLGTYIPFVTDEDTPLTIPPTGLLANDYDIEGNPLTAALDDASGDATVVVNPDGSFTYTPHPDFNTRYGDWFSYIASDDGMDSWPAYATVIVNPVNDAPVANSDAYTTAEDTTRSVDAPGVLGNDTDVESDPLSAVWVSDPTHGDLVLSGDGSFKYVPDANFVGTDTFTYRADDGQLPSGAATVRMTVTAVNDPPVAVPDPYTISEDTTLLVDVPETVINNDSDTEGDGLTAEKVAGPYHGTVAFSTQGTFTYRPDENWNGIDSFSYKLWDGAAHSVPTSVTITVDAVNDRPVTQTDYYSCLANEGVDEPAPGVLGNDSDPDAGDVLSADFWYADVGTAYVQMDGAIWYTPPPGWTGTAYVYYYAMDGDAAATLGIAEITVETENMPPEPFPDDYDATEDTTLVVAAPGVLANDVDPDTGDVLTAHWFSDPTHGSLTLNSDGSFTYVPEPNFHGPDQFTYYASDGELDMVADVTIDVASVNDRPVAMADSYFAIEDQPLMVMATGGVLVNDTDIDHDVLSAASASDPPHGTVALNANGSFVYTPDLNYYGTDTFTYVANDDAWDSMPATVTITVSSSNDLPVAAPDAATVDQDSVLVISAPGVLSNDTDAEGGPLSAVLVDDVDHGTLALMPSGQYLYVPAAGYAGTDAFTYCASDGDASSLTVTVSITVRAKTTISVTSAAATVAYGATYTLAGVLSKTAGPVAGRTVTLEKSANGATFSVVSVSSVTGAGGTFALADKPSERTWYRARFAGDGTHIGSTGPSVLVQVKPSVGTPKAPKTMSKSKYYAVYGYLKPRHTAGTYPVRVYKYKKTSSGKWKSYGYVKFKAYNYSTYTKYYRKIRLPYAGKWRLRAYAPADAKHVSAWSSGYDYVTVK